MMNDTDSTASALRYDSADTANTAATANDGRHAIQTYLSDALALERHIAQPLQRQLDMDDSAKFTGAAELISTIKALADSHIANLETALDAAGGDAASPVKSAWSQLIGAGAAVVDSARKTKVSKNLRDDYTALALATAGYTMLNATALGLGNAATAQLAKSHLGDYAKVVVQISRALPGVVLEELALDGENVQVTAAQIAEQNTADAWQ
jgi:ferritin-like metal-binding protein YciE